MKKHGNTVICLCAGIALGIILGLVIAGNESEEEKSLPAGDNRNEPNSFKELFEEAICEACAENPEEYL